MLASAVGPLLIASRIWLVKVLIDTVLRGRHPGLVAMVAGLFVLIPVLRAGIQAWDTAVSGAVGAEIVRDLRVLVYGRLQRRSLSYFHTRPLGDLLTRLSGDIAAIEDLLVSGLTTIIAQAVTIVLFLTLLVVLNSRLVVVALGIVPALGLLTFIDSHRSRRVQHQMRNRASELTSVAEEGLSAIAVVKAFARAPHEEKRFALAASRSASARLRSIHLKTVFPPLSDVVVGIGTAVVIWTGARQVLAGQLSLGSLVVFVSYLGSLYVPVQSLGRVAGTFQRALVGAHRVAEILDPPPGNDERCGAPELPSGVKGIELSRVTFGYRPDRPVLHDVSLKVRAGETLALIGPSGAGKTSVVSLMLCYYEPDRGQVLLGKHRLDRFDPDSCRQQVAAALQEPMLFNTTVRENIRYGRLEAEDHEIERAAEVAQADGFIRELPEGYETVVGPRGAGLSGGQRQRVAIARAVLKQAPVLLLDEATSALDPATEAGVLHAVRMAFPERAMLLVAHRLSTIRHADRVVVLERGRILEEGTPGALLARGGRYSEFVSAQTGPQSGRRRAPAIPTLLTPSR